MISTWIIDRRGLRTAIFIGVILVFLGGLICAISSFPGIGKHISRSSISASYLHNLSGVSEEKLAIRLQKLELVFGHKETEPQTVSQMDRQSWKLKYLFRFDH